MTDSMLELRDIEKRFDGGLVLRGISLSIERGEILSLLGPSGSGKTTLLRIIAGLEKTDKGQVLLEGQDLAPMPVHERRFGMVFQDYALFPHKDVAGNIAFGLRMLNWSSERVKERVTQLLALVGLPGFGSRAVYDLSGGEQQRVALARALAASPRLLLLDEPLGALDRAWRARLMGELRTILKEAEALSERTRGITAIYVTHDQAEAFAVADRVAVIRKGAIEQVAAPMKLYLQPSTRFVARFIGMENILPAKVISREPPLVSTAMGELRLSGPETIPATGGDVHLLIRPESARLLAEGEDAAANVISARLGSVSFRGRYQRATVHVQGSTELILEFDAGESLPPEGSTLRLAIDPSALVLLCDQERTA